MTVEADPEPESDLWQPEHFAQACPACHSKDVHRSRTRSMAERLKKSRTEERLFRCHACGWRGWQMPHVAMAAVMIGGPEGEAQPDLKSLDSAVDAPEAFATPAFSPRNLN